MTLSRRAFLASQGAAMGAAILPGPLLAAVEKATPPTPRLDDWAAVRRQFRLSPEYLHFAGFFIASHPEPVRAAIDGYRRALDDNPFLVVEHGLFATDAENLELRVAEEAAKYLGGKREEIALTGNTTTGLALVYHGLSLGAGDEILITTHDHVVHHEAIRLAAERNGAAVRRISLFDEAATATIDGIVGRVRAGLREETRVLGITWVHSSTGIRLPVREIAEVVKEVNRKRDESKRLLLVVDGVHGLGAVDETVAEMGADYFCAGTHKWIFGPRGTGLVWARPEAWARLRPLVPSFSSTELFEAWKEQRAPRGATTADRITPGGFHAFEHQWGLAAAFRMHEQMGRRRVTERVTALNDQIKAGLAGMRKIKLHTPRDARLSAGICCFEVEGHTPAEVVTSLLKKKIIASTSPYAVTYARLSAGLMNSPAEVDKALAAVRTLAGA